MLQQTTYILMAATNLLMLPVFFAHPAYLHNLLMFKALAKAAKLLTV